MWLFGSTSSPGFRPVQCCELPSPSWAVQRVLLLDTVQKLCRVVLACLGLRVASPLCRGSQAVRPETPPLPLHPPAASQTKMQVCGVHHCDALHPCGAASHLLPYLWGPHAKHRQAHAHTRRRQPPAAAGHLRTLRPHTVAQAFSSQPRQQAYTHTLHLHCTSSVLCVALCGLCAAASLAMRQWLIHTAAVAAAAAARQCWCVQPLEAAAAGVLATVGTRHQIAWGPDLSSFPGHALTAA